MLKLGKEKQKANICVLAPFLTLSPAHFHDLPQQSNMCRISWQQNLTVIPLEPIQNAAYFITTRHRRL